jgi:hypothetical protein
VPKNPLVRHPPWRQIIILSVVAPLVVALAVLAFTWPAARTAPRSLPVGVVGTGPAVQQAVSGLTSADPNAFDLHLYADDATARTAIKNRDVYGAFEITSQGVTVLTASAGGTTVAQLLSSVGEKVSAQLGPAHATATGPAVLDVVKTAGDDPRGAVLASAVSPLVLGGVIIAVIVAVLVGFRPAWRELLALVAVSAVAGLGAHLVIQSYLGAMPGDQVRTWAALSLMLFAISSTVAGMSAVLGPGGVALGAALMVFVGNPFSGVTSAPELMPDGINRIGQFLPPGAGANLLRSTAYFDGHGATSHLLVLGIWSAFGVGSLLEGHRRMGRRQPARHSTDLLAASPLHDALTEGAHERRR